MIKRLERAQSQGSTNPEKLRKPATIQLAYMCQDWWECPRRRLIGRRHVARWHRPAPSLISSEISTADLDVARGLFVCGHEAAEHKACAQPGACQHIVYAPERAAPCTLGSSSQSPQMPACEPASKTQGASLKTFMGTPAPQSCNLRETGFMVLAGRPAALSNARKSSPATRSSTSLGTASCGTLLRDPKLRDDITVHA